MAYNFTMDLPAKIDRDMNGVYDQPREIFGEKSGVPVGSPAKVGY